MRYLYLLKMDFKYYQQLLLTQVMILIGLVSYSQSCDYPDLYLDFSGNLPSWTDKSIKTSYDVKDTVKGFEGSGLQGKLVYSLPKEKLQNLTIELMFKTPDKVWKASLFSGLKVQDPEKISPFGITFSKEKISINLRAINNGDVITDSHQIGLSKWGVLSPDPYFDHAWHHLIMHYDYENKQCIIVLDGKTCSDFTFELPERSINVTSKLAGYINSNKKISLIIDQVAFYFNSNIKIEDLVPHQSGDYKFCDVLSKPPVFQTEITTVDTLEFPKGYTTTNNIDETNDVIDQLHSFPNPRYHESNQMHRNFPWISYHYVGGRGVSGFANKKKLIADRALVIQSDLIHNWNYSCTVFPSGDASSLKGRFNLEANLYPEIDAVLRTNWHFASPKKVIKSLNTKPYMVNSSLLKSYYFSVDIGKTTKLMWKANSSVEPIRVDGVALRKEILSSYSLLTRPIDLINENGEMPALIYSRLYKGTDSINYILDKKAYLSDKVSEIRGAYKSEVLNHPYFNNTNYSYYSVDGKGGHTGYNKKYDWKSIKKINSELNDDHYSTMDFYPYSPGKWDVNSGASHGYDWVKEAREIELTDGDELYSPFVCAGWRSDSRGNVRPAQYLSLLKALGATGAEFYYASYFNDVAPEYVVQDPKIWIWQVAMPSYAQAVISHAEYILKEGTLLRNTKGKYVFNSPDNLETSLNVIREWYNSDSTNVHYLITSSIQTKTNKRRVNEDNYRVVKLISSGSFPGAELVSAYEGRTYILELDKTEEKAPVFYCLDGWHEPNHPERWSKELVFEAELYDGLNSIELSRKTELGEGSHSELDFSNFTTFMSFEESTQSRIYDYKEAPSLTYNFQSRNEGELVNVSYIYLRVRAKETTNKCDLRLAINEGGSHSTVYQGVFGDEIKNEWQWVKLAVDDLMIKNREDYQLKISLLNNQIDLDQFVIDMNNEFEVGECLELKKKSKVTVDFELNNTCANQLELINYSHLPDDKKYDYSFTLAKNWVKSWKSGKKDPSGGVDSKGKYYITGWSQKENENFDWWNHNDLSPVFFMNDYGKKTIYVKMEVFEGGKRIGKMKQKVKLSEVPKLALSLSKDQVCFGDTATAVVKGGDGTSISLWEPELYVLSKEENKAIIYPYKSSYIYLEGVSEDNCVTKDSVYLEVTKSEMNISFNKHSKICEGDKGPLPIPVEVEGVNQYWVEWIEEGKVKQVVKKNGLFFLGNGEKVLQDQLIKLVVKDDAGCVIEDYLFLEVKDKNKCK